MATRNLGSGQRTIADFKGVKLFAGLDNKIESRILRRSDRYDRSNFTIVESFVHQGSTCFDIGANIGIYSLIMAKLAGSAELVHAFEPVDHIRRRLFANLKLNGFGDLKLNSIALGAEPGEFRMFQIREGEFRGGVSSLYENDSVKLLGKDHFEERPVKVETLDGYCDRAGVTSIQFIKIDVEGAELNVLEGGKETLTAKRPVILFEFDPDRVSSVGQSPEEYKKFFDHVGYRVFEYKVHNTQPILEKYEFGGRAPRGRNLVALS